MFPVVLLSGIAGLAGYTCPEDIHHTHATDSGRPKPLFAWYIRATEGMSVNSAVKTPVGANIATTIDPVRGFYSGLEAGIVRKRLTMGFSLSRSLVGLQINVPGTLPHVPEFPLQVASKHPQWAAQLLMGFQSDYKRFSFWPQWGIGKPMIRSSTTQFSGTVVVNGKDSVNVFGRSTVHSRGSWNLQFNMAVGYRFPLKNNRQLVLSYVPGYLHNLNHSVRNTLNIRTDKDEFNVLTDNHTRVFSHAISLNWQFGQSR